MKTILHSAAGGAAIFFLIGTSTSALEALLTLQNETLKVEFNPASKRFSMAARATPSAFVTNGQLSAEGGLAKLTKVSDPTFGRGQAIEVSYPDGNGDTIMLFPKLPFVLFRASRHNNRPAATVTRKLQTLSAAVALGRPAAELTTLGTGGLLAPDKNPGGMKAAADNIKAHGLVPGIWFMPFAGTYYDPFFKAHQDWFVKRENGEPFETAWGGTCLDMTHPGARTYLHDNIRRIGHEWGYQYFKMDGLWTGTGTRQVYVNSGYRDDNLGESVLHNPEKTNLEAYRDGLKLVRAAAGKNTFILGCCTPQNMRSYGGAFGLVDAMRIGPDNGANWKSLLRGPTFGTRQYFLHGRVWYNDPDPVYVRASLPLVQAQAICSWVALSGQLNLSSEWMPELPADRLDLLKRTLPNHGLLPRPADLFEDPLPRLWLLTDNRRSPRRDVVGIFNWNDQEQTFDYPLSRLGLADNVEYVAFDYWQNSLAPLIQGRLQLSVPPQSCRILAVRPRLDRPQLLSTSRHITQGIVDVREEKWIDADKILRGRSQIVGNDPYELRVALPAGGQSWSVKAVEITKRDRAAGVKTTVKEADGLVRVTLESPASREVSWSVRFAK